MLSRIRYNYPIARRLVPSKRTSARDDLPRASDATAAGLEDHVIICGYGRIGQSVGHFLEEEKIRFIALDLDASRVREAHLAGEPVFYGDAADRGILESVGIATARLMVISHHDTAAALRVLQVARQLRPGLPVMARTRDESQVDELRQAGAVEVVPETLEAAMMIAAHALLLLDVPLTRVVRRIQEQRGESLPAVARVHPRRRWLSRRRARARTRPTASGTAAARLPGGRACPRRACAARRRRHGARAQRGTTARATTRHAPRSR